VEVLALPIVTPQSVSSRKRGLDFDFIHNHPHTRDARHSQLYSIDKPATREYHCPCQIPGNSEKEL
ncbi:MAG: hypothetical protein ACFFBV_11950, partial [Promethearchaeota archaeon]